MFVRRSDSLISRNEGFEPKHGCPSGPRGYVKAVMCSHSRVRVPLRAFLFLLSVTENESGEQGWRADSAVLSFHARRASFLSSLVFDLRGSTRAFKPCYNEKTISSSDCESYCPSSNSIAFSCYFYSHCFSRSSTFDGWGGSCSARMTCDTNPVLPPSIVLYSVITIRSVIVFGFHNPSL